MQCQTVQKSICLLMLLYVLEPAESDGLFCSPKHPPGHVWCSMHITLHLRNEKSPNVIHFAEKMSECSLDGCLKLADCLSASLHLPYRSSQTPEAGNIVAWDWNLTPVSQSRYSGVNLQRMYLHVARVSNRQEVVVDRCGRLRL